MLVGNVFISNSPKNSKGGEKMVSKSSSRKDKLKNGDRLRSPLYFSYANTTNNSSTLTLNYFGGL
jgi:hypothetical protein